jgi:hypothetical protein
MPVEEVVVVLVFQAGQVARAVAVQVVALLLHQLLALPIPAAVAVQVDTRGS